MIGRKHGSIVALLAVGLWSWGLALPANADSDHGSQPVVVTFTKWINGYPSMAGVVGGDLVGDFAGEVLERQETTTNSGIFDVVWLLAIYDVEAGDHSFTALVKGGQHNKTNKALLNGTILGGWRTGAPVHVQFVQIDDSTVCTNAGAPPGTSPCFTGTIHIGSAPK
jgi:hypothetical protein